MKDDKRKWPVCRKCRGRVEKVNYPDYICDYCKRNEIISPSTKEGLSLMLAWQSERAEQASKPKEVEWEYNYMMYDWPGYYECDCGYQQVHEYGMWETGINFCPGCGGRIKEY